MTETIEQLSESIAKKYKDSQKRVDLVINQNLLLCLYDLGKKISIAHSKITNEPKFYVQLSNLLSTRIKSLEIIKAENLALYEKFYNLYQQYYSQFPFDYEKAMDGTFITDSLYRIISIPWSFHVLILNKCRDVHEAFFYVEETYYCGWTREQLFQHLKKNSYKDPHYKADTTGRSFFNDIQKRK